MDDLDGRLEAVLGSLAGTPVAEAEPLAALRRRTRRHRVRRSLAGATAVVVGIGAVGAVIANRDDEPAGGDVQVAAPTVLLGNIDASVLSTSYDADGARSRIDPALLAVVSQVAGVKSAVGAVQRFATIPTEQTDAQPRTPVVVSVHEPDEVVIVEGAYPTASDEVLVNAAARDELGVGLGDPLPVGIGLDPSSEINAVSGGRVSGIFALPDGDVPSAPVIALPTTTFVSATYDRIDVTFHDDADPEVVLGAIQAVLPNPLVVFNPTQLGTAEQMRAELDIQRAYWWLISTDPDERQQAAEPSETPVQQSDESFNRYLDSVRYVEMRVGRVDFLAPDRARVTYRFYYSGGPSPIFPDAQTGEAVEIGGRWYVAATTTCALASLAAETCAGQEGTPVQAPAGWQAATTAPGVELPLRALADPHATAQQRIEAIDGRGGVGFEIEDGLANDSTYTEVRLVVAGVRGVTDAQAEVLYSIVAEGPTPIASPYPISTLLTKQTDGRWVAPTSLACGVRGLALGYCEDNLTVTQNVAEGDLGSP